MTRVRYYVRVGCGVRAFGSHWSASVASSQLGHCGKGLIISLLVFLFPMLMLANDIFNFSHILPCLLHQVLKSVTC